MKKSISLVLALILAMTMLAFTPALAQNDAFIELDGVAYAKELISGQSYDIVQSGSRDWNTHRLDFIQIDNSVLAGASYIAVRFNSGSANGGGMTLIARDSSGAEYIPNAGGEIITLTLDGQIQIKQLVDYNGINGMSWAFPMYWSAGFDGWLLFPLSLFPCKNINGLAVGYAAPTSSTVFDISNISALSPLNEEEIYIMSDPDYIPVMRFLAVTDLHFGSQAPGAFQSAMDHLYKMVQAHPSYNKLDAVISSGDNVQVAQDEDYIKLRAALDGSLKEGTQFISCYGNHEYLNSSMGWLSQSEADALWNKYIGLEMDGVYDLNGFKIITNSPRGGSDYSQNTQWLANSLAQAEQDGPDKPIFVFQHFQAPDGGYGSDETIASMSYPYEIMKSYSQIINFSGHTHLPLTSPSCVRQEYYTSVVGGYWFYNNPKAVPASEPVSFSAMIVEVDASNEVRIYPYSFRYYEYLSEQPYVINSAAGRTGSFAKEDFIYTDARRDNSQAPSFSQDAQLNITAASSDKLEFSFSAAQDDEMVVSYKAVLSRRDTGAVLRTQSILSDYGMREKQSSFSYTMTGSFAGIDAVLSVYALDPYGNISQPLSSEIAFPGERLEIINFDEATDQSLGNYIALSGKTEGYSTAQLSLKPASDGQGQLLALTNVPENNANFIYTINSKAFAGIITYGALDHKYYSMYIKNQLGCELFFSAKLYSTQKLAAIETNDHVYLKDMQGNISKASTDIGSRYDWLSFMDTRYAVIPKDFEGYIYISLDPKHMQQGQWNGVNIIDVSDADQVTIDIRGFLPDGNSISSIYLDNLGLTKELAVQEDRTFQINVQQTEGGVITVQPDGRVKPGSSAAVTITPQDGYIIEDVIINGGSVGAVSSYTLENIQADISVSASFKKLTDSPQDTGASWMLPALLGLAVGLAVLAGVLLIRKRRLRSRKQL